MTIEICTGSQLLHLKNAEGSVVRWNEWTLYFTEHMSRHVSLTVKSLLLLVVMVQR